MNLRQKAVKGVVWSAIQNFGSQAGSLVIFFLLARLLDPEIFGLVALATVFLVFIQVFLDQGFTQAIIQCHKLEQGHLDTAFWTNLGIGILLTVFGIAAAGVVATLFKQPELTPIIQWLSLSFLISSLTGVQQAILQRQFAFKVVAARSLAATLVGGVVGIVMAFQGFGVWSIVTQRLVNELVAVLVLWQASDWRPSLNFSIKHFRELFTFGINVVGFNFLNFFNRRADDFLIGYFLGPVALGYYTVAYRVLRVMTELLVSTSSQVAMSTFSRLQKEPERLRQAFYTITQLASFTAFPTFSGMAVLAPDLVRLLFGDKWLPCIPVMQVLAFIGILHSTSYFNANVLLALGKPSWRFWLGLVGAVTNVIGFALAVQSGIVSVAAAYVICGYLISPISLWVLRNLIQINVLKYLSQFTAPVTGSLVMAITMLAAKEFLHTWRNSWILLAVCTVFGMIVYLSVILLLAPRLIRQLLDIVYLALSRSKTQKN